MREWVINVHFVNKLPVGVNIDDLISHLRIFSWEASDLLLYYSRILKDLDNKINIIKSNNIQDPVTLADLKVNEIIIKRINEYYKNIEWDILSEENVKNSMTNLIIKSDWLWVLDPLDGTKDFIQGTENYAMHLALNYKQKPLLGIVLIPDKNELWITDGVKVWAERKKGKDTKPSMTNIKDLNEMRLVTSKNHGNKNLENLIEKIHFKEVIIMGSIGCKIASILRGESDIYISLSLPGKSSPKDWDFAAPHALLKAAGGAITNLENEDLTYNKLKYEQGGIIIASNNKQNHKLICLQIKEIIKDYSIYPIKS